MKRPTFKQCYAVIVLLAALAFGWLYLKEHRYINIGYNAILYDTWKQEYVHPFDTD